MNNKFIFRRFGGYECSSKGDKTFSAFFARLRTGKTIEEIYQLDIKGYRKYGNDPRLGKGKPPITNISYAEQWRLYKSLWIIWSNENPELIDYLRTKAENNNHVLSDRFANSYINQARALAEILSGDFEFEIKFEEE